jgi:hypothetical protein
MINARHIEEQVINSRRAPKETEVLGLKIEKHCFSKLVTFYEARLTQGGLTEDGG